MDEGIVNDWEKMEKIWSLGFQRMGVSTTDSSLVLTEAALNPLPHREKMLEVFMEKFQFSRVII
jgi:actin-related protein